MVAAAAALLEKAAKLSTQHWPEAAGALDHAVRLRRTAEELVEEDSHAYFAFVEALRAAKGTVGEARERAIGPARSATVEVPLAIVRSGSEVVALAVELAIHGNPNLRADAVVAATLAAGAAEAAAGLIAANLAGEPGDPRAVQAHNLARGARARVRSVARPSEVNAEEIPNRP